MTISFEIPDEMVERIAERVADLLEHRAEAPPERWLNVTEAAAHIAATKSRLYALTSAGRIPHHRDGSRLLFRASELDHWISADGGGKRP